MLTLTILTFDPASPLDGRLLALLPEGERERVSRVKRPDRAKAAALGRLLARFVLSQAAGRAIGDIVIQSTPSGKPFSPGVVWEWNLSHTRGAAAVALSDAPVGVDIEAAAPLRPAVLERAFSKRERQYVLFDPDGRDIRFFEIWTRKEAFLKRSGRGLSGGLHTLEVLDEAPGCLTTLHEGDYIVSVSAEEWLEEKNVRRLHEEAFRRLLINP